MADETARTDPATKDALRYRTAPRYGYDSLSTRPIGTNLAVEIGTILRGIDTGSRRVPVDWDLRPRMPAPS